MLRFFILFFVFVVSLHAISDSAMLKRADSLMKTNTKTNQFRAYNDYKSLYIRSIMAENEKLQINALEGIVKSGKKLHIDISQYSQELLEIKPKISHKKQKTKINAYVPTQKTSSKKKITKRIQHHLKYVKFEDDKLVLKFNKPLTSKQINYFTIYDPKHKKYRYVFDIHGSMNSKSKNIKKKNIKRIFLAQNKPNTIRLVIENNKPVKVKFMKDSSRLIISMNNPSKLVIHKNKKPKKQVYIPTRLDRNKTIVIDAGHGGKDPGAVGYKKYREKIVVMSVASELKKILKSRGYKVYMTRDRDKFVKLSNRTKYANKKDADIFVSIHANAVAKRNAHKVHGIECYFLSKSRSSRAKRVAEKENSADMSDMNFYGKQSFLNTLSSHNIVASNKLAIDLQRGMLGKIKKSYPDIHDGGVREGPFWVLVGAQMPSVLVEVGFISHPKEARRLVKLSYRKKIAQGLANGIERYFANCK